MVTRQQIDADWAEKFDYVFEYLLLCDNSGNIILVIRWFDPTYFTGICLALHSGMTTPFYQTFYVVTGSLHYVNSYTSKLPGCTPHHNHNYDFSENTIIVETCHFTEAACSRPVSTSKHSFAKILATKQVCQSFR